MKSFYEVLEVAESASAEEIHSAYLRLAREYHPDRVPEHLTKLRADAEEKFKQVQEAWTVLGDPAKRQRYDQRARATDRPGPAPAPANSTPPPVPRILFLEALRRHRELLKWATVVVAITAVLILIGGFFVSHEAATRPVATEATGAASAGGLLSGIRHYSAPPRHIRTWDLAGGKGLDVELLSVDVQAGGVEIFFRARAGAHNDLLLYEPPGGQEKTRTVLGREVTPDQGYDGLYIQDSAGTKYYSTTGLIGGQQLSFNIYNFTRRVNFRPGEEVVLSAKFPTLPDSATSITFVSPALAKWQPEWRWPAIALK